MPDVAPLRLHISRRYGFPFHRAARTLDGRLATAGFLARGSSVSFQPSQRSNADRQWHMWKKLAAYSCGRSRGFDKRLTAFPNTVTPLSERETATYVNSEMKRPN